MEDYAKILRATMRVYKQSPGRVHTDAAAICRMLTQHLKFAALQMAQVDSLINDAITENDNKKRLATIEKIDAFIALFEKRYAHLYKTSKIMIAIDALRAVTKRLCDAQSAGFHELEKIEEREKILQEAYEAIEEKYANAVDYRVQVELEHARSRAYEELTKIRKVNAALAKGYGLSGKELREANNHIKQTFIQAQECAQALADAFENTAPFTDIEDQVETLYSYLCAPGLSAV